MQSLEHWFGLFKGKYTEVGWLEKEGKVKL
jgi:hypothetical protein